MVRQLLMRQCVLGRGEENAAKERFLVNQLGLPPKWISEAKVRDASAGEATHPSQPWTPFEKKSSDNF